MNSVLQKEIATRRPYAAELATALEQLRAWAEERDYAGHEPYDVLNSPHLSGVWKHSALVSSALIQLGRYFAGERIRKWLDVPQSKNPKAVALFLSGYCDLMRCSGGSSVPIAYLRSELRRLASPNERDCCWGYDWNFVSLRGSVMKAYAPNTVATVFCAEALLDSAELLGDSDCAGMALSSARFCVTRLNRSFDSPEELCFSYTPENRTLIYNSSLLVGALLARIAAGGGPAEYYHLARRTMQFVCNRQRSDGSWAYGCGKMQAWVDSFHTGYNLCALSRYRRYSRDSSYDGAIAAGLKFYKSHCFTADGIPKYFANRLYPIDIHACSQAVLTLCEFADHDQEAIGRAVTVALWTIRNMRSVDGCFYYQRHRFWTNRTPYMRWAQAWMFRALARLLVKLKEHDR